MPGKTEITWPLVLFALLGVAVFMFGANVWWWWLAHRLTWWLFALAASLGTLMWLFGKELFTMRRALRKSRERQATPWAGGDR